MVCVGLAIFDGTCFQPWGGMEGRHEEYMFNKARIHAMFAECLENTFSIPEQDFPFDSSSSSSPTLLPASNSDLLLPPLAEW